MLEKQHTLRPEQGDGNISQFTVHNLDMKSDSENSFNRSEDADGDSQLADTSQMKITTSKMGNMPRVTAPHGFSSHHKPPKFGGASKKKAPGKVAMHQTLGGMQPWHEMKRQ